MEGSLDRFRRAFADPSLVVLEGFHALKHAVRFGADLVEVVSVEPLAPMIASLAPDIAVESRLVSAEEFEGLSPRKIATGVIAIARRPVFALDAQRRAPVVLLENPRHLGNVGAAVRVAAGAGGWRWGIFVAGVAAAIYGVVYWFAVDDTPPGQRYERPRRKGALPVGSRAAAFGLAAMQVPVYGILGLVAWRVYDGGVLSPAGLAIVLVVLAALLVWQVATVLRVNAPVLRGEAPDHDYPFAPVALLSLGYGITFGAELAVVSLLPTFFASTFGLEIGAAGVAGSAFAFTNLVTRPGGGVFSDRARSRRRVVQVCLLGTAASFVVLSTLDARWPLGLGIAVVAVASVFVQGGNGAIFAMVPQIHKPVTGQIAGLAGSYGNIGGIAFSSVLFFTSNDTRVLFLTVAGAALVVAGLCHWLPDLGDERAREEVDTDRPPVVLTAPEPAALEPAVL